MEGQQNSEDNTISFDKCGACKDNLVDREPKLLPCLHSVCKPCLLLEEPSESNRVTCPVCKTSHSMSDVMDNYFLQAMSSASEGNTAEQESPTCTACEENATATAYCVECGDWLCNDCSQAHKRVKITKDHTIQPSDGVLSNSPPKCPEPFTYCQVHKKEKLKLFCEHCEKLTCRDCQIEEHKDHKYQFVDEAAVQHKQMLANLLEKIKEKQSYINNALVLTKTRYKEIQSREEAIQQEIKQARELLFAAVNEGTKQVLSDLKAICQTKKKQLVSKHNEIKQLSKLLCHSTDFTQHAMNHPNNNVLLHSKRIMIPQLKNVLRTRCDVPNPGHVIDIRFTCNHFKNLQTALHNYGSFQVDGLQYRGPNSVSSMGSNGPSGNAYDNLSEEQKKELIKAIYVKKLHQQLQQQNAQQHMQGIPSNGTTQRLSHPPLPNTNVVRSTATFIPLSGVPPVQQQPTAQQRFTIGQLSQIQQQQQKQQQQQQKQIQSQHPNATHMRPLLPKQPTLGAGDSLVNMPGPRSSPLPNIPTQVTEMNNGSDLPLYSQYFSEIEMLQQPQSARSNSTQTNKDFVPFKVEDEPKHKKIKDEPMSPEVVAGCSKFESNVERSFGNQGNQPVFNGDESGGFEMNISAEGSITPPLSTGSDSLFNIADHIVTTNQNLLAPNHSEDDPSEDYCAVCHNGGDLLCCDKCPKVFHLNCHVPVLEQMPRGSENWQCGMCSRVEPVKEQLLEDHDGEKRRKRKAMSGLTDQELKACEKILLILYCDETSIPFHEPVPHSTPNYYKIIKEPMDFKTIKRKLRRGNFDHYNNVENFVMDLQLVFGNCAIYNDPTSEIGKVGVHLDNKFKALVKALLPNHHAIMGELTYMDVTDSSREDSERAKHKRKCSPDEIRHLHIK